MCRYWSMHFQAQPPVKPPVLISCELKDTPMLCASRIIISTITKYHIYIYFAQHWKYDTLYTACYNALVKY